MGFWHRKLVQDILSDPLECMISKHSLMAQANHVSNLIHSAILPLSSLVTFKCPHNHLQDIQIGESNYKREMQSKRRKGGQRELGGKERGGMGWRERREDRAENERGGEKEEGEERTEDVRRKVEEREGRKAEEGEKGERGGSGEKDRREAKRKLRTLKQLASSFVHGGLDLPCLSCIRKTRTLGMLSNSRPSSAEKYGKIHSSQTNNNQKCKQQPKM